MEVMGLMEWSHYRLGVRRMVIDLFEKNVMRQIVFDEDSSASSEDDDEEDEEENRGAGRGFGGSREESSEDDRTERQRSVSEPADVPSSLMPAPLKFGR